MSQQAQNDYYPSRAAAAMDYAVAVNEEIRDLLAAGADIVQVDEPYMQAWPDKARQFGLAALNRALEGKTILLGCLDLNDPAVDTPATIVERIRRALPHVPPERAVLAPDCGMKYLPRDVAFGKMTATGAAAKRLRAEFGAGEGTRSG